MELARIGAAFDGTAASGPIPVTASKCQRAWLTSGLVLLVAGQVIRPTYGGR